MIRRLLSLFRRKPRRTYSDEVRANSPLGYWRVPEAEEVELFPTALSAEDIRALYDGAPDMPPDERRP